MNYLMENRGLLLLAIIGMVVAIFIIVKLLQTVGLEKIRATVYQLFLDAEHQFEEGDNDDKFEYVINLAKAAIPAPFNLLITETLLRSVVQAWFDIVKDLLDDGRVNGSEEGDNNADC